MMMRTDNKGIWVLDQCMAWEALTAVGIRTTADGPFAEDVFWHFLMEDGVIELPGEVVTGEILGAMQDHLPGFNSVKVILAMGSTSERMWRLWHRTDTPPWNPEAMASRFVGLVERLGGSASGAKAAFERLWAAWGEGTRIYHSQEHLMECLRELDSGGQGDSDVAELAVWYHDVVHVPGASDSETQSAAWLLEDADRLGISQETANAAAECVHATDHSGSEPRGPLAAWVADIDLAILASDPLRFMEYEYAVEEEYASFGGSTYFLGRGRFLSRLLESETIFHTEAFRERYEARARRNLSALLESPRYRSHRWFGGVYRLFAS